MANTLKLGAGKWATGTDTVLAFNDENNNFKPLPFDFSRASSATVVNQSGLIETVGSGTPRIDFLGNTKGALLLEPSRSNIILQSQDITTGWSQGNAPTLTSNIAVAPDGTMTADGIQSETDGAFRTIRQLSISVSANSTITNSYFVKKETSEINYGGFGFVFSGGTTKVLYGIVNSVNGTVTYDTTLTPTTKVENYGSYWKISTTVTDTGSNTSLGLYYYGTLSINGTSLSTGVGSVRTIWGMQLELNSSYATSYIPTSGSAVTRVAESTSQTVPDGVIGQTEGTVFLDSKMALQSINNYQLFSINNVSSSDRIRILTAAGNRLRFIYQLDGGSLAYNFYNPTDYGSLTSLKIAFTYKSGDIKVYINGVLVNSSSNTFTIAETLTNIDIATSAGGYSQMFFNDVKLYNTALTSAELQALTTI